MRRFLMPEALLSIEYMINEPKLVVGNVDRTNFPLKSNKIGKLFVSIALSTCASELVSGE